MFVQGALHGEMFGFKAAILVGVGFVDEFDCENRSRGC